MTHLTDLQCSMYADEELPGVEVETVASHIESCDLCRDRLAEFVTEKRLIGAALAIDDVAIPKIVVPKFTKPAKLRTFAIANVVTGLVFWLTQFLWKTLFGELVVSAFSWITFITIPDVSELLVSAALYFSQEGTTMIDTYLGFIVLCLSVVALTWFAWSYRKARSTLSLCFLAAVCASTLAPPSANALEFRRSDAMVTIEATETIDDTLIIAADTVVVEGTINGDLIAVGERVVVTGSVSGNLISFADSVSVRGQVGGFFL